MKTANQQSRFSRRTELAPEISPRRSLMPTLASGRRHSLPAFRTENFVWTINRKISSTGDNESSKYSRSENRWSARHGWERCAYFASENFSTPHACGLIRAPLLPFGNHPFGRLDL